MQQHKHHWARRHTGQHTAPAATHLTLCEHDWCGPCTLGRGRLRRRTSSTRSAVAASCCSLRVSCCSHRQHCGRGLCAQRTRPCRRCGGFCCCLPQPQPPTPGGLCRRCCRLLWRARLEPRPACCWRWWCTACCHARARVRVRSSSSSRACRWWRWWWWRRHAAACHLLLGAHQAHHPPAHARWLSPHSWRR
jgi:hypothetical protein